MDSNFCAYIQHVTDVRRKKNVSTSKMFVLSDKPALSAAAFHPKSSTDFRKGSEYGVVEGSNMVRYYILLMAENETELVSAKKLAGRIKSPPARKSLEPSEQPLSDYQSIQERENASKNSTAKVAFARQATKREHGIQLLKAIEGSKKKKKRTDPVVMVKASKNHDNAPFGLEDDDFIKLEEKNPESVVAAVTLTAPNLEPKETPSLIPDELNTVVQADIVGVLSCPLLDCCPYWKEAQNAKTESWEWKRMYEDIRIERDLLKEVQASNVKKIEEIHSKLPVLVSSSGKVCFSTTLETFVVDIESSNEDFNVPEGHVYVGAGHSIARKDLVLCSEAVTLRGRCDKLVEAFYGAYAHELSFSGKCKQPISGLFQKVIPDIHVTSVYKILLSMPWDSAQKGRDKLTLRTVRENMRKRTYELRQAHLNSLNPGRAELLKKEREERKAVNKNKEKTSHIGEVAVSDKSDGELTEDELDIQYVEEFV